MSSRRCIVYLERCDWLVSAVRGIDEPGIVFGFGYPRLGTCASPEKENGHVWMGWGIED